MATRAARSERRPRPPAADALTARVREQLAVVHDRELGRRLGRCGRCGNAVRSEQEFIRQGGAIIHVRCPIKHAPSAGVTAAAMERVGRYVRGRA